MIAVTGDKRFEQPLQTAELETAKPLVDVVLLSDKTFKFRRTLGGIAVFLEEVVFTPPCEPGMKWRKSRR